MCVYETEREREREKERERERERRAHRKKRQSKGQRATDKYAQTHEHTRRQQCCAAVTAVTGTSSRSNQRTFENSNAQS